MEDSGATLSGECSPWPSKEALTSCLRNAGLRIAEGAYAVRVDDCEHFVFQHYGSDLAGPSIDADGASVSTLLGDAERVSIALSVAGIRHRFEIYDSSEKLAGYLHYGWPRHET
jgi:hypothetical protein